MRILDQKKIPYTARFYEESEGPEGTREYGVHIAQTLGQDPARGFKTLVEMNRYYKEKDPDRLVHYEGVAENRPYEDLISDMESQMYAPPEKIKEYLENNPKKPFILCEYMHDMGNSLDGILYQITGSV